MLKNMKKKLLFLHFPSIKKYSDEGIKDGLGSGSSCSTYTLGYKQKNWTDYFQTSMENFSLTDSNHFIHPLQNYRVREIGHGSEKSSCIK